jgi:hypothetical protein
MFSIRILYIKFKVIWISVSLGSRIGFCFVVTGLFGVLSSDNVVNSIAKRIWGSYGLSIVLSLDNGFFLFTFDSVDHATNVLERAP